jgi:hypothetical protein
MAVVQFPVSHDSDIYSRFRCLAVILQAKIIINSRSSAIMYLKTYPLRFAGKQWHLTKPELAHVLQLKKKHPDTWEKLAIEEMERRSLGDSFSHLSEESVTLEEVITGQSPRILGESR